MVMRQKPGTVSQIYKKKKQGTITITRFLEKLL